MLILGSLCRLKEKGRTFRESFLAKLCLLLRGTVAAPPERFGETLADEHIRGGEKIWLILTDVYMLLGEKQAERGDVRLALWHRALSPNADCWAAHDLICMARHAQHFSRTRF